MFTLFYETKFIIGLTADNVIKVFLSYDEASGSL